MKILSLTKLLFWYLTIVCSLKVGDKFSVSFYIEQSTPAYFFLQFTWYVFVGFCWFKSVWSMLHS